MKLRRLSAALLVLTSAPLIADEFHYNNILIGDRAPGFGGAYTAISDDPTGLFYNPAGIVYGGKRNFSASVNSFSMTTTSYRNVLGGQYDWVRESSGLVPNFFGVTQPLGDFILGFSYAVTDYVLEDQNQTFQNFGQRVATYHIDNNQQDTTNLIGPSAAFAISDSLSIGLTAYFHNRKQDIIFNQWVRYNEANGEGYQWSNTYKQTVEYGVMPILGLIWSPIEKVSLGMTLRHTMLLSSTTETKESFVNTINSDNLTKANQINANDAANPIPNTYTTPRNLPFTVTAGVALFPTNRLILAADLAIHSATSATLASTAREMTINWSLGAEYYMLENWALRAGYYTNNANSKKITSTSVGADDHINLQGVAMSLSRFTRTSSLTLGFNYAWGSGKAQPFGDNNTFIVDSNNLLIFLSSGYSY
jgi:hypothetical protein